MLPRLSSYPRNIHKLISRLRTPLRVQAWIRSLAYNPRDTMRGLGGVVRTGRAHCLEAAMSAAAILEHHGYPPLILDLESADGLDHTLFLYRRDGKFGAVGMSRDIGLAGRRPVYRTIESLVRSYAAPYIDAKANITAYGVLDLRTLPRRAWRSGNGNHWYVEETLRKIPHRRLRLPRTFVRHWRRRFIAFRRKHPDRQPPFYPRQHQWA